MIDMYADIGSAEEALQIVERMKQRRMKFNVSIYNSLINLYMRTNQHDKAIEAYRSMKEKNVPLNFQTFKPMLQGCHLHSFQDEINKDINASNTISELSKSVLKTMQSNRKM